MLERIIKDVACAACACLCDDLTLKIRANRIADVQPACPLAQPWFASSWDAPPSVAQIDGRPATIDEGIRKSAEILRTARAPLVFGLSKSSTEGQRAAVALADRLGATIDTTASEGHAPSILAMQQVGESTCSLGEIRNRADLIVYWGADPVVTHPRHMERYSLEPKGMLTPRGRLDRQLVVIDSQATETARQADWFVQIDDDQSHFDVLWTLLALLKGVEPERSVGVPLDQLKRLVALMKSCRCGVVFFGYGLVQHSIGHRTVEALLRLVTELNQWTRFYARRLRVLGDVSGADSVVCWQTGYPFSVNLARGYPRYSPGEYSAADILSNREADALLLVGTSRVEGFPPAALEYLQKIPTIVLDRVNAELPFQPTVQFTTATHGIHRAGIAYRMDEIPVRLRPVLDSPLPSDGEILNAILDQIES